MTTNNFKIALGSKFEVGRGATPTWTEILGIKSLPQPSRKKEEIEVTNMSSPNARQYIAGIPDSGTIEIEMLRSVGSAGDVLLKALDISGETVQLRWTMVNPNTPGSPEVEVWSAFLKEYQRDGEYNQNPTAKMIWRLSEQIS